MREPWHLGEEHESMCVIESLDNKMVAVAYGGTGIVLSDRLPASPHSVAERIVACVNALEGVPLEMIQRRKEIQIVDCGRVLGLILLPRELDLMAMKELLEKAGYIVTKKEPDNG